MRSAVGFNQERGDVVEVVNTRFVRQAPPPATEDAGGMMAFLGDLDVMRIVEIVGTLVVCLAFVFFVLRPLVGGLVRGGGANPGAPAIAGQQLAYVQRQLGNFPQAYTHVGLINAAFAVSPPWSDVL